MLYFYKVTLGKNTTDIHSDLVNVFPYKCYSFDSVAK